MKTWLVSVSAVSLLSLSGPSIALASSGPVGSVGSVASAAIPSRQATTQAMSSDPSRPDRRFEVNSSVQVSRDVLREAYMASREAYTSKLQKYAKCSPAEAKKAIASAHPKMKIENFQLRNVRTSLVYMATAENDEDRFLVIVDAGNGKVLLDRPIPTHHERVFAGGQ